MIDNKRLLRRMKIGFILTPGFRTADVVQTEAIFRIHPLNKIFFIAEKDGLVKGKSNFDLFADTTYNNCPNLDILVIGEMSDKEIDNSRLLRFIAQKAPLAKYVIGISNGVWSLYMAGVLSKENVTADRATLPLLEQAGLNVINERRCIVDGKFITSGPSTGAMEAAFTVFQKTRGTWLAKFAEFNFEYNDHALFNLNKEVILKQPPLPQPFKIGVFSAPDLYITDIMGAADVFGAIPNSEFYYMSHEKGKSKSIFSLGPTMNATTTFDNCPDLDVMIFGATHPRYIKDAKVLDFILKQEKNASAIISVCAGTFIVGSTGLLEGKEAATNYHQVIDLPKIGVYPTGKVVAEDGKYFSAGPVIGSYQVALKAVEKMVNKKWAQYIEHEVLEFAPKPVLGTNPQTASKSILFATHSTISQMRRAFHPAIKKGYFGQGVVL